MYSLHTSHSNLLKSICFKSSPLSFKLSGTCAFNDKVPKNMSKRNILKFPRICFIKELFKIKKTLVSYLTSVFFVEHIGFEPMTSTLPV